MEKILAMSKDLSSDNLHLLQNVYSPDIQFIDPAHEINGLGKLTEYFSALYHDVISIEGVLPLLRKNVSGWLAIVGSSAAYIPLPRAEAYGASKAAVAFMANSLRIDLRKW